MVIWGRPYDTLSNKDLVSIAEHRGILSEHLHNELMIIRGVEYDPRGQMAREQVITKLSTHDAKLRSLIALYVGALSLLINLIRFIFTYLSK